MNRHSGVYNIVEFDEETIFDYTTRILYFTEVLS